MSFAHFTDTSDKMRELAGARARDCEASFASLQENIDNTSMRATRLAELAKTPSDAVFDLPVAAGAGFYNACDLR